MIEKADRLVMEKMGQDIEILKRQVKTLEGRSDNQDAFLEIARGWMTTNSLRIKDLGRLHLWLRKKWALTNYRVGAWTEISEMNVTQMGKVMEALETLTSTLSLQGLAIELLRRLYGEDRPTLTGRCEELSPEEIAETVNRLFRR